LSFVAETVKKLATFSIMFLAAAVLLGFVGLAADYRLMVLICLIQDLRILREGFDEWLLRLRLSVN
jgi:hypothetical protein